MNRQKFQISLLRLFSLFCIVYDNESYIFGPNYKIKILEFENDNIITVSRSYYAEHLSKFQDEIYSGKQIKIPRKESELIELLLLETIKKPNNKTIEIEMTHTINSLCSRCSGKGFMDWVDESIGVVGKTSCQSDYDFMYKKMLYSYVTFITEDYTFFYRQRNTNDEYMKDCKICSDCGGVGFDLDFLVNHLPKTIAQDLGLLTREYIKSIHQ